MFPESRTLERFGIEIPRLVSQASQSWRLSPFSFPYLELLRIVRTLLWEETRIEQAERVALIGLLGGLTARLGYMAGNASGPKRSREAGS